MKNDKATAILFAIIVLAIVVIIAKHYDTFNASLSAGSFAFNVQAARNNTTLVNLPVVLDALASQV